jgi:hypothetical protein
VTIAPRGRLATPVAEATSAGVSIVTPKRLLFPESVGGSEASDGFVPCATLRSDQASEPAPVRPPGCGGGGVARRKFALRDGSAALPASAAGGVGVDGGVARGCGWP